MDNQLLVTRQKVSFLSYHIDELLLEPDLLSVVLEELSVILEQIQMQQEQVLNQQQKQTQNYQAFFNNASEAYLITNFQGIIQNINSKAAKVFCQIPFFIIHKPFVLFIDFDDHSLFYRKIETINQKFQQGMSPDSPDWQETLITHLHPQNCPPVKVKLTLSPLYNDQFQLQGLRWLIQPIS